jgi:uncharacterized protein YfaS (alpha-2-macroglobulin family)
MIIFGPYDQGALVRVTRTFVNSSGSAIDPAVVKFQYRQPNGPIVTKTYGTDNVVVKDSTGVYHIDLDTTALVGTWSIRGYSTGTGQDAIEGTFAVNDTHF